MTLNFLLEVNVIVMKNLNCRRENKNIPKKKNEKIEMVGPEVLLLSSHIAD